MDNQNPIDDATSLAGGRAYWDTAAADFDAEPDHGLHDLRTETRGKHPEEQDVDDHHQAERESPFLVFCRIVDRVTVSHASSTAGDVHTGTPLGPMPQSAGTRDTTRAY